MPEIAVIGPGAIGAIVTARLAQKPGNAVTVCVRTPFSHLRIDSPQELVVASPKVLQMIVALLEAAS